MHIVILIAGILAGAAFWWYRLRAMGQAANEVIDHVGRVKGSLRRRKIRRFNEMSPITAIDDPVVAAATLIAGIVADDAPLSEPREAALRGEIDSIAEPHQVDEATIYAKWAVRQVDDAGLIIDRLGPFLRDRLSPAERTDLLTMVERVASASGPELPAIENRVTRLRQKLGLPVGRMQ